MKQVRRLLSLTQENLSSGSLKEYQAKLWNDFKNHADVMRKK